MIRHAFVVMHGITSVYGIDRRGDWHLIARSDHSDFSTMYSREQIAAEFTISH